MRIRQASNEQTCIWMYPFVCLASKKVLRYVSICSEFLAKSNIFSNFPCSFLLSHSFARALSALSLSFYLSHFAFICSVRVIVFHNNWCSRLQCKQLFLEEIFFFIVVLRCGCWLLSLCIFHSSVINYLSEAFIASLRSKASTAISIFTCTR